MKKAKAGIQEKGIIKTFERRGVIIAKSNFEITLDSAEEDAIECGAEEVNFYYINYNWHFNDLKL